MYKLSKSIGEFQKLSFGQHESTSWIDSKKMPGMCHRCLSLLCLIKKEPEYSWLRIGKINYYTSL